MSTMSGTSRLLSELESAAIAGVSVDTIRQFRGCGLLDPVQDEGKERFREIDIKTLFYNRTKAAPAKEEKKAADSAVPTTEDPVEVQATEPSVDSQQAATSETPEIPPGEVKTERPPFAAEQVTAVTAEKIVKSQQEFLPVPSSISTDHLIEANKGLREQLEILREERDWLRARVEKLETRSEREQMLLLSESENIRKLIQQGEQKRAPWFRALPWFGK